MSEHNMNDIQKLLEEQRKQSEVHKISEGKINRTIANKEKALDPKFKEKFQGENNPNYGKRGELSPIYGKPGHLISHSEATKQKMSISHTGEKNYMYGKTHTQESRLKISKSQSGENSAWYGKKHTEQTKQKQSEAQKGVPKTTEHKKKISDANKGKTAYNKGISRILVTCPHCGKEGGQGIMGRWHFDNCKHK